MSNPKPRDVDHGPESEPQASGWAELVRAQAEQVRMLTATIERQARMMELMLGSRALAAPAAEVATAIVARAEAAPDILTLADLWTAYLASLGNPTWVSVITSLMSRALAHFAPSVCRRAEPGRRSKVPVYGPDMLASQLRIHHWQDFINDVRRLSPGISIGTRRLFVARMQALLNWAVIQGRIEANPLANVKAEKPRPKRQTRVTEEYLQRLRPFATDVAWAYILAISDSGARPGEIRTIKRHQINRATGHVLLSWTNTKTKKTRPIWLTPRVLEAFDALPVRAGNEYVFQGRTGNKPLSKVQIWSIFRTAADKAGLEAAPGDSAVRAHDARRNHATELIRAGVSIPALQGILGHSDIGSTMKYVDVEESDLIAAHEKLPSAKRMPPKPIRPSEGE